MQADMNQWYKDTKETTKLRGKLTFERIKTSNDWPKLKCKAAAVRHLLRYAEKLASPLSYSLYMYHNYFRRRGV